MGASAIRRKLIDDVSEMHQWLMAKAYHDYCSYVELTNYGWIKSPHLIYVCNAVQQFLEGGMDTELGQAKILVISMPPQHGKTLAVTETLPSWFEGKHPHNNTMILSYGMDLALRFGRRNKEKIKTYGKPLFDIEVSKNKKSDAIFELEGYSGGIISTSIMGGVTGNRADLMLIDDPIKNREQADSEVFRERLWAEFLNSVNTRLSAMGKIILIQTRWHEDDLAGRILRTELLPTYYINIPCEAEENDILGREVGDPLFPEIGKDKEWLELTKNAYVKGTNEDFDAHGSGLRAWNALYQGRPIAVEGNMIKKEWWNYYDKTVSDWDDAVISLDCSFKGTETSDFVVLQAWGKSMNDFYLLDQKRGRMNFTQTLAATREFVGKNPYCRTVLIEDKANGPAVIEVLQNEIIGIVPVDPKGSKESRVSAVSPAIESGHVYLPKYVPWVQEFVDEFSAFPHGRNDDMVDCATQALSRLYFMGGKYRKIKPKGFYTPKELEEFNSKYNKHSGSVRRPGKVVKNVDKHSISF